MPDDKIEVLDDFILDMDIETITLDDVESKDSNKKQTVKTSASEDIKVEEPNLDSFTMDQNGGTDELSIPTDTDFTENEIHMDEINQIEETPEPAMPVDEQEMIIETPSSINPADDMPSGLNTMQSNAAAYNSEDDIISMSGSELDKIIYGGADTPEAKIDDVVVVEEPILPEDENIIENTDTVEELLDTKDLDISDISVPLPDETISTDKPESADFNFDLSVIPDVAEIEEDEPIALSMDELNNIDISEGNVIEFPAAEIPTTPDMQISAPEEEEVEMSEKNLENMAQSQKEIPMDELNDIQADITGPVKRELRSKIIEEKMEALSPETRDELRSVLVYLDNLLEDLPEDKIKEFAKSEYYDLYVKIMDKLGI